MTFVIEIMKLYFFYFDCINNNGFFFGSMMIGIAQ